MADPDDQKLAHYVLRHFGSVQAIQPGSFYESLIRTITAADPLNQRKLEVPFPTLVQMVRAAQNDHDGIRRLKAVAFEGASW